MGGRPHRLELARECGATQTLDYHQCRGDLAAAVKASCPEPFPNVLEASGSAPAAQASLELVAREGKVLILGDYGAGSAAFRWNHLLHREIELMGSNASAGAWPEAVRLLTAGELPLQRLITHPLPAAQFAAGLELVRGRAQKVIKVILQWPVDRS